MAPNVTVSFWAPGDINNPTPLRTITDEHEGFKGFTYKPDLYGLGGWELRLARSWAKGLFTDDVAQPEVFVRFLIHAYSDTEWYGGGLLNKRRQTLIHKDEDGAEEFVFGGPGPKGYLDRYRLGIELLGTGTLVSVDLENGVWRFDEAATAGRILNRIINEDGFQDDPALADLTDTFTTTQDSDGVAWANDVAGPGDYEIPIGTSLLEAMWDLEDLSDLYTVVGLGTVAAPAYELHAYQSYGEDVTGSAFGAGVGLLREGVNIAEDSLEVEGVSLRKVTHVIVEGKDGAWTTVVKPSYVPGGYVKWGKISYSRSSSLVILEKAGLRWLRRQDNGDQEIEIEILPGADEGAGLYFPAPGAVIWPGNTITVDSSADGTTHTPLDFTNEPQLVTGLEVKLGEAGDTTDADHKAKSWHVKVKLNHERGGHDKSPNQRSAASGGGSCKCIGLCVDAAAMVVETSTAWKFANGAAPAGWHLPGFDDSAYGSAIVTAPEVIWYDGSSNRWIYTNPEAAAAAVFRTTFDLDSIPVSASVDFTADNEGSIYVNGTLIGTRPNMGWHTFGTFSVDPDLLVVGENVISIVAASDGTLPSGVYAVLTLTGDAAVGTDSRAAHCDHSHVHGLLLGRDSAAQHPASAVSFDPAASPLASTDVQAAIDEHANDAGQHGGGTPVFVGFKAYSSATQSIPNTADTKCSLNQEEFDSHGFHDNATNNSRGTVPAGQAGKYLVGAMVAWDNNTTGGRNLRIMKNGATVRGSHSVTPGSAVGPIHETQVIVDLAVGDFVEANVFQNSGGARTIGSAANDYQQTALWAVKVG